MSRKALAHEAEWLGLIEQLPCIVCEVFHDEYDTPAETHHIDGQTKPDAHLKTIRLCTKHHSQKDNTRPKRWLSRHGDGKTIFQNRYFHEMDLLKLQQERVWTMTKKV